METTERQTDFDAAGQVDMLQVLRSASLPDDFWMYSYKILPCPHGYRHSWTHCPFSHAGETARRRCPRAYNYLPDPCVNARAKRQCPNGDACPYAHNTFEQWLHPARYRTRLCYLGANCRRPTCFFAHSVEELRSVDENEPAQPPATMPPLPPLPSPPPLPAPAPLPPGSSGADFGCSGPPPPPGPGAPPLTGGPAPPGAGVGAGCSNSVPMGVLQPVALVCMPPPQSQPPSSHGAAHHLLAASPTQGGYVAYPGAAASTAAAARPMGLQHPPAMGEHLMAVPRQPLPPPPAAVYPAASGMFPVAVPRPQARPHQPGGGPSVPVATIPASPIHVATSPSGPVYVHGGMGPMPPGVAVHVAAPPPPPPHPYAGAHAPAAGPYYPVAAHGSGEAGASGGAPGRARAWSNPGEGTFMAAAPGGTMSYMYGENVVPSWQSMDSSRRAVTVTAPPPPPPLPSSLSSSYGNLSTSAAPRHMPAPTNRGNIARRVSTPASIPVSPANNVAAAAAAAAATIAMRFPGSDTSAGRVAGAGSSNSHSCPLPQLSHPLSPQMLTPARQPQQPTQAPVAQEQVAAALNAMTLTSSKPVAAPPPTPAASHAGGSPYSPSLSPSPLSAPAIAAAASGGGPVTIVAGPTEINFQDIRQSYDGIGGALSRPSSSGSSSASVGTVGVFDGNAAATAAALAAAAAAGVDAPADAVAAVAMPYRVILQHVLRSASASSADPPAMLLPALLSGGAADVDGLYDDVAVLERSSDPGPGSLRAAIRRISNELGSVAASRNSDPGQPVPSAATAASPDVQQLLLPLLQSVLTEGLATGQFELVNGQLQVKGCGGSPSGGGCGIVGGPLYGSSGQVASGSGSGSFRGDLPEGAEVLGRCGSRQSSNGSPGIVQS